MKSGFYRLALATVAAGLAAPAAVGQSAENPFLRGRHVAVTDRAQPEYDAIPIRAGAFNVSSSLTAGVETNSNVLAQAANEESDVIIRVRPQVDINSTWSSHELAAGFSVNHREYTENDSETATDYNGYLRGSLDVVRGFRVNGQLTSARLTEPRYEIGSQNIQGDPSRYDVQGAELSANFQRDRIQIQGAVGVNDSKFDRADQQFRDVTETFVSSRVGVAISPDLAVFVQGRAGEYDYETVQNVTDRDATRTDISAGLNFESHAPFRGEISVGYVEEDKKSNLPDTAGVSVNGLVQWFPTQLTTVTATAQRSIYDPGIQGSGSAFDTNIGLRVDHELRRNIVVFAQASVGQVEIDGANDQLARYDVSLGAGYRINRNMRLDGYYSFYGRDEFANVNGTGLEQHVVGISLRLQP